MSPIIQPKLSTCGNCRYGKLIQIGVTECWGVPPTPVVMGGKPGLGGGVELQIELMRARQSSNQARCALWDAKDPADIASLVASGNG